MAPALSVVVTTAGVDDHGTLVALATAAEEDIARQRGGTLLVASVEEASTRLRDRLDAPDHGVLLGRIEGEAVGYAVVGERRLRDGTRLGSLDELYVAPPARGVGLGAALLAAARGWCRERGCVGLDAVALPGDRETKNFFESHGLTARLITVHTRLAPPDEAAADPGPGS
ncbi:MAG: GNAT family N-acetyltransferase [Actinomyces sp.]|nr:MAG: GNAT family N-acetyltransferase [Actinomyces sp.]